MIVSYTANNTQLHIAPFLEKSSVSHPSSKGRLLPVLEYNFLSAIQLFQKITFSIFEMNPRSTLKAWSLTGFSGSPVAGHSSGNTRPLVSYGRECNRNLSRLDYMIQAVSILHKYCLAMFQLQRTWQWVSIQKERKKILWRYALMVCSRNEG